MSIFPSGGDPRTGNLALRSTGEVRSSGAAVPLLFLILQEVGWLVSGHPPLVHLLEGWVATGVVHAPEGSVPAR